MDPGALPRSSLVVLGLLVALPACFSTSIARALTAENASRQTKAQTRLFPVSANARNGTGKTEDLAALGDPLYNLQIIPSVRKGAPPDIKQLTALTLQNVVVHRIVEGKAAVLLGESPADPLSLLKPLEIFKAVYCELDFDLPYGEVAYEYR